MNEFLQLFFFLDVHFQYFSFAWKQFSTNLSTNLFIVRQFAERLIRFEIAYN